MSRPKSLLESLGAELMGILAPVSACMLIVVLLVRLLMNDQPSGAPIELLYDEDPSDSGSTKLLGALLNAFAFVAFVTIATFVLVALFYCGCGKCLRFYMAFSTFLVLSQMGGALGVVIIQTFSIPVDVITFSVLLLNFAVLGTLCVFSLLPMPILFTQSYLVIVGVLVAFWFTSLPEWTTWVLLLAMAAYDVAAVLLPGGPLNLLVQMAMERNEELPALVYEARPLDAPNARVRRHTRVAASSSPQSRWYFSLSRWFTSSSAAPYESVDNRDEGAGSVQRGTSWLSRFSAAATEPTAGMQESREEESAPLVLSRHIQPQVESLSSLIASERTSTGDELELSSSAGGTPTMQEQEEEQEENGEQQQQQQQEEDHWDGRVASTLGSGGIKLGLGDFVFYSVLVGRAAMYDLMTVYACYLAIVAGLGATLLLLAVWQRALPALPISISLGVLFYFLTRLLLDPFVVQLATRLVFF